MVHLPAICVKLVPLGASTYLAPAGIAVYKPEQYMLSIILSLYTLALPWEVERVLHSESSLEVLGLQSNTVSAAAVRKAHRVVALAVHPDRLCRGDRTLCDAAQSATVKLNAARDELLAENRSPSDPRPHDEPTPGEEWWSSDAMMRVFLLLGMAPFANATATLQRRRRGRALGRKRWRPLRCIHGYVAAAGRCMQHVLRLCICCCTRLVGMWRAHAMEKLRRLRLKAHAAGHFHTPVSLSHAAHTSVPDHTSIPDRSARFHRFWDVIIAARACDMRRVIAEKRSMLAKNTQQMMRAFASRMQRQHSKAVFNGLSLRKRRWLLVLAALLLQYFIRQPTISVESAWQEAVSGTITNMHELQQHHEASTAVHSELWSGMQSMAELGPDGLDAALPSNCPLALLDGEALQLGTACVNDLTVQVVAAAEEASATANGTAHRALRAAARQAVVAEAAAVRAASTARALHEATIVLHRAWQSLFVTSSHGDVVVPVVPIHVGDTGVAPARFLPGRASLARTSSGGEWCEKGAGADASSAERSPSQPVYAKVGRAQSPCDVAPCDDVTCMECECDCECCVDEHVGGVSKQGRPSNEAKAKQEAASKAALSAWATFGFTSRGAATSSSNGMAEPEDAEAEPEDTAKAEQSEAEQVAAEAQKQVELRQQAELRAAEERAAKQAAAEAEREAATEAERARETAQLAQRAVEAASAAAEAAAGTKVALPPPVGRMPQAHEGIECGQMGTLSNTVSQQHDSRYDDSGAFFIYVSVALPKRSSKDGRLLGWETKNVRTVYTADGESASERVADAAQEANRLAWKLLHPALREKGPPRQRKRVLDGQDGQPTRGTRSSQSAGASSSTDAAQNDGEPSGVDNRATFNGGSRHGSGRHVQQPPAGRGLGHGTSSVVSSLFCPAEKLAPLAQFAMLRAAQQKNRVLSLQLAQQRTALEASQLEVNELKLDLSRMQRWAAQQALQPSTPTDALPSPRQLAETLGSGYSLTERGRTFYNHYYRAFEFVTAMTAGDLEKTRSLFEYAAARLHVSVAPTVSKRQLAVQSGVLSALREFFTAAYEKVGKGRPPKKLAQSLQAVLTAIARAPELGGVSMAAVADALALSARGVAKLSARATVAEDFVTDGVFEQLFDDRCVRRSDAIPQEQIDWLVQECWLSDDFTRESEKKGDEVYDPTSRKQDRQHHRKRWLELPLCEFYSKVAERGKERWKGEWTGMSSNFIREYRPYWVKDATRDVCMCRYHLEFDLLAKGLSQLRKAVPCPNNCDLCKACPPLTTGLQLRAQLTCPRPEAETYDARACVDGSCTQCSGLQRLSTIVCPARREVMRDQQLKWERYEKRFVGQDPTTGEDKYKHDFFQQQGSGAELIEDIEAAIKKFNPHHDLAKQQDADWTALKRNFPRGSFVSVQDFSENFHHQVRFEPQSKYYQQVDSSLYMVVIRYHLDDATTLPAAERARLRAAFEEAKLPPIIVETLAFISGDLKHDGAFIRHVNDKYVVPYVQSLGKFDTHYARSDGCKGQFKNSQQFDWVSRRQSESGVRTDWSFFCSCHGKCDCDPEGGAIKTAAGNFEKKGDLGGMRVQAKLPDSAALTKWCIEGSPADSPHGAHLGLAQPGKSLSSRLLLGKRDAIYRRHFFHVPAAGPQGIKRTYAVCELKGSARLHSFVDVGQPGRIMIRERSCHQCPNCWAGHDSSGCMDEARFGRAQNVPIARPKAPESSIARVLRDAGGLTPDEMAPQLNDGMMVSVAMDGNDHEPWFLGRLEGDVAKATAAEATAMKEMGYKNVKPGQRVLHLTKFEPFQAGSRRFVETKVSLVVPLSSLRRHQLVSNSERARRPANLRSARYGDTTFELKEADLRAIVAVVLANNGGIGDFHVERLCEYRVVFQRGKPVDQWLVKWRGWERPEDMTWEPLDHFDDPDHLAQADQLKAGAAKAAAAKEAAAERAREAAAKAVVVERQAAAAAKTSAKEARAKVTATKRAAKKEEAKSKKKAKKVAAAAAGSVKMQPAARDDVNGQGGGSRDAGAGPSGAGGSGDGGASGSAEEEEESSDGELDMSGVIGVEGLKERRKAEQAVRQEEQCESLGEAEQLGGAARPARTQQGGDDLQAMLDAKAAEDTDNEAMKERVGAEVDAMMDNGVRINPVLRAMYGGSEQQQQVTPSEVAAREAMEEAAAARKAANAADNAARTAAAKARCSVCLDLLIGESGSARAEGGWGKPPCCYALFHYECLASWLQRERPACPACREPLSKSRSRMLEQASQAQEAAAAAAVQASEAAEAAVEAAEAAEVIATAKEEAARTATELVAQEASEAEQAAKEAADAQEETAATTTAAVEAATARATAAAAAARAAAYAKASYDSVDDMLDLAGLEAAPVFGDGNCGYYACLEAGAEGALTHCRRNARTISPSASDYQVQQDLRRRSVEWLSAKEQATLLKKEKFSSAEVKEQLKGRQHRDGPMGTYANGPALRAMAAVEQVHLVVVTTFTGPSVGRGFKGHGRAVKGCPTDRVAVYPPKDDSMARIKSWANDVVPVLLRAAAGVCAHGEKGTTAKLEPSRAPPPACACVMPASERLRA